MLAQLYIKNFAIIDEVEVILHDGMHVITGETGVGKSIVIDALVLCLGQRADSKLIRKGAEQCEISASFNITQNKSAQQWLIEHDLNGDNECILRRIITKDGRSRCYINGSSVTLTQLQQISQTLVNIHGQHQQQDLLKRDKQKQLVDSYGNYPDLLNKVAELSQHHQTITQQIIALTAGQDQVALQTLLRYQVDELEQLGLASDEIVQLESEHKQLTHSETLIHHCQQALHLCSEQEHGNIQQLLQQAQHHIASVMQYDAKLLPIQQLLENACIHIDEASNELNHYLQSTEINNERLHEITERLDSIYQIARKHKIQPEQLYVHTQQLRQQLDQLQNAESHLQTLTSKLTSIKQAYHLAAVELSQKRQQTAKKMAKAIEQNIQRLGMPQGKFQITVAGAADADQVKKSGLDTIEFLVSANPGQELQPLAKVASGGEISRISLAIQVLSAQRDIKPCLIFDEVDVGIGGSTAAIVGQSLRHLSQSTQVICITHLPQVAAYGIHHYSVDKTVRNNQTFSRITLLTPEQRIQEIARMLGGQTITQQTLAHAAEMCEQAAEA
ncbi:MAG: DNA repair protein RecN [Gammaproteobacteria bacterium]